MEERDIAPRRGEQASGAAEHSTGADAMIAVLTEMFATVRAYLLGAGREASARGAVSTNPKGEATRAFDAEAERLALAVAERGLGAFRAFSEEQGELVVGGGSPRWTLVIDPCDGSNNFRRGVRATGFAVAALPAGAPLDPALVEYAVCGDIFTGSLYSAVRGRGALLDGQPCRASTVHDLRQAMVSINIGRIHRLGTGTPPRSPRQDEDGELPMPEDALRLMSEISTARRIGATVLDLCYVAQGAFDAYVDVRGRLTAENFMAPALIIQEAGGVFTDAAGRPLGPVAFTAPHNVVAAGSAELHAQILATLRAR
ncbi:MAG TPA: inositol monophosphatase family protein [Ktedonobacterales bacterium]|nr:inositol monophosphatase family protein [Ktedonobacterales bacterium]